MRLFSLCLAVVGILLHCFTQVSPWIVSRRTTQSRGVVTRCFARLTLREIMARKKEAKKTAASSPPPSSSSSSIMFEADDEEGLGVQENAAFRSGFVSILGNPNVGKSSLLNALLGEKLSIVSPKPQTTRHRILGILSQPAFQVIFSDTPGMLETPAYSLQESMMESVRGAMSDGDLVLLVTDVFGEPLADERVREKLPLTNRTVLVVVNKMDLIDPNISSLNTNNSTMMSSSSGALTKLRKPFSSSSPSGRNERDRRGGKEEDGNKEEEDYSSPRSFEELTQLWRTRIPHAEIIGISAANGYNVSVLQDVIVARLPEGPRYFPADTLTTRDERFFASEIIREALFHAYQDEVPYSCEVRIASFIDRTASLSAIEAEIVVDKDSQKAILIGKGGGKLKELGIQARLKLEEFLQRKIFLSLRVKVDSDWRRNKDTLARFGYIESDFG